jgi:hypothetical protein
MTKGVIDAEAILNRARPLAYQEAPEIQPQGHLAKRAGWRLPRVAAILAILAEKGAPITVTP